MCRCRSLGPVTRLLGGLELGDDAGQPLGDRVVDLARHPAALVEHARLARLRQQLGVQAGVLLEGSLEPGDRQAPMLALFGDPLAEQDAAADDQRSG